MKDEIRYLHTGYTPGNGEPRMPPIVQSTTYVYDSAAEVAAIFDDLIKGFCYSQFGNPTVMAVEQKIAELEGGVEAVCTTSGQTAMLLSVFNICMIGDSIISTPAVYGGTTNLLSFTLKKPGIECIYVNNDASDEEIRAASKPNTKLVFSKTTANPVLKIFNIEKFASTIHEMGIPLIAGNTFATPILCKPFAFDVDIMTHSTSKYMDGHAVQISRAIIDSGKFNQKNDKLPEFTESDKSYHGISYMDSYGNMAYIIRTRMQLIRDFGVYPAAHSAFSLNLGSETLFVRMKQYCEGAMTVIKHLEESDTVENILYPELPGSRDYKPAKEHLKGCSGVISFVMKGGRPAAAEFMDSLKLVSNKAYMTDVRTCVLHPASETYRQLTDEQLAAAGIDGGVTRFSAGPENIDDIMEDPDLALKASMS